MALDVIGLGVGRTGTYSLKLALEALGFGPCHHMEEVSPSDAAQVALWTEAAAGRFDWAHAYAGFRSALDWPTAAFAPELAATYPDAKFVLTVRDPERWCDSISSTIYKLVQPDESTPREWLPFLDMVVAVMRRTGFPVPADRKTLLAAYADHNARITALIPADRLLVFDVKEGWTPLCRYLGVPVPDGPFPRTNSTQEFWTSAETGEHPPAN